MTTKIRSKQALLLFGAATYLAQSLVNAPPEQCTGPELYDCATPLSLLQKRMMKTKSERSFSLLQEYSQEHPSDSTSSYKHQTDVKGSKTREALIKNGQEHSLMQEKMLLSKTNGISDKDEDPFSDIWDDGDGLPSVLIGMGPAEVMHRTAGPLGIRSTNRTLPADRSIDPIEELLDTLDIPVSTDPDATLFSPRSNHAESMMTSPVPVTQISSKDTLDIPVTTDPDPWPPVATAAPSPRSNQGESTLTSPAPEVGLVETDTSSSGSLLENIGMYVQNLAKVFFTKVRGKAARQVVALARLTKETAIPLQEVDLRPVAEETLQQSELPPNSFLQDVASQFQSSFEFLDKPNGYKRSMAHHDSVPVGDEKRPFSLSLPSHGQYTILCGVVVLVVLLCAACPGSSNLKDIKPKDLVEELGKEDDTAFYYFDPEGQAWVQVEVEGKLQSGKLLLRWKRGDSTVLVSNLIVADISPSNFKVVKLIDGQEEGETFFPSFRPYNPKAWGGLKGIAESLKWHVIDAHSHIVGFAHRRRQKHEKEGKDHKKEPKHLHSHLQSTARTAETAVEEIVEDAEELFAEELMQAEALVEDLESELEYAAEVVEKEVTKEFQQLEQVEHKLAGKVKAAVARVKWAFQKKKPEDSPTKKKANGPRRR